MPDQSQKVIQKPESDPVKQREPGKKSLRAQKTNSLFQTRAIYLEEDVTFSRKHY